MGGARVRDDAVVLRGHRRPRPRALLSAFNLANASMVALGALVGSRIFSWMEGSPGAYACCSRCRRWAASPRSPGCAGHPFALGAIAADVRVGGRPAVTEIEAPISPARGAPTRRRRRRQLTLRIAIGGAGGARRRRANGRRAELADAREPAPRPDELGAQDHEPDRDHDEGGPRQHDHRETQRQHRHADHPDDHAPRRAQPHLHQGDRSRRCRRGRVLGAASAATRSRRRRGCSRCRPSEIEIGIST